MKKIKNMWRNALRLVLWLGVWDAGIVWVRQFVCAPVKVFFMKPMQWNKRQILHQLYTLEFTRSFKYLYGITRSILRVAPTYQCNAHCSACYARGLSEEVPSDMSLAHFEKTISWAMKEGWKGIRFVGGEPTCHPHFKDFLSLCFSRKLFVTLSTNNLFDPSYFDYFRSFWMLGITVNYNVCATFTSEQRAAYFDNLKRFRANDVSYGVAVVLTDEFLAESDDVVREWLREYKPSYVKTTFELPEFGLGNTEAGFSHARDRVYSKMRMLQDACLELEIAFYNFRAVPTCFFTEEQRLKLTEYSPLVLSSRCEIGYKNDYTLNLVVNPDLTTFACPSIFVLGKKILDYANREDANQDLKERIALLCKTPSLDRCSSCAAHTEYAASFSSANAQNESKFFSASLCQGGCHTYKWAKNEVPLV